MGHHLIENYPDDLLHRWFISGAVIREALGLGPKAGNYIKSYD